VAGQGDRLNSAWAFKKKVGVHLVQRVVSWPAQGTLVPWTDWWFESGAADHQARVSWAEMESPTAPRQARVSWAEGEVPTAPRRGRASWAELEAPLAPRKGRVSWAELEAPLSPRRVLNSWAELEVPLSPRKVLASWAELEVPPDPRKRGQVSYAELQVPDKSRLLMSWAEFDAGTGVGPQSNILWRLTHWFRRSH
jgi:hypothetical protein